MFYTYPSQEGEGFCIDIYKGTTLINSYCTDRNEQKMLLKEGKETTVFIDFSNDANNGSCEITDTINNWTGHNFDVGFD